MNLETTIKFLRKDEWSMGNGQCHECCGNEPGKWYPHPCVPSPQHEGHAPNCDLAKALLELGQDVIFRTKEKL